MYVFVKDMGKIHSCQVTTKLNNAWTWALIQYTDCGDKMILWLSYLHNWISYTGQMTSLYWIGALNFKCIILGGLYLPYFFSPSTAKIDEKMLHLISWGDYVANYLGYWAFGFPQNSWIIYSCSLLLCRPHIWHCWSSARLQYIHCWCTGDTAVLPKSIHIIPIINNQNMVWALFWKINSTLYSYCYRYTYIYDCVLIFHILDIADMG